MIKEIYSISDILHLQENIFGEIPLLPEYFIRKLLIVDVAVYAGESILKGIRKAFQEKASLINDCCTFWRAILQRPERLSPEPSFIVSRH